MTIKVNIQTIPHDTHRYDTVGDYWTDPDGTEQVRVSEMGDWRYELLIAVHELVESHLCKHRGISEPQIMKFDKAWELAKLAGAKTVEDEPGFAKDAPYMPEHHFSTGIEMLLAQQLDVHWPTYCELLNRL
jgi:hypothetical protein